MRYLKNPNRHLRHILALPFISILIIPMIIMDISVEIYHRICFPLCGIPCIKRRKYIQIDRHKLKYLNLIQKLYCMFCGYANGIANYWVEIAGETEHYWCGIKHRENPNFVEPTYHKDFAEYDDEKDFNEKYKK